MSRILEELRFAFRGLRKSPILAGVAILTLGFGIGMNALMFSIVYGVLFRGLPFPDADRIVRVSWIEPSSPDAWRNLSVHDYEDVKAGQRSILDLAGAYTGTVNLVGRDRPVRYEGAFVTANAFDALQVQPILGRGFMEEEARPGAPLSIILGHHVWEGDFGLDPQVLGQTVRVNGELATVVGVMPEGFKFPEIQDVWVPYRVDALALTRGEGQYLQVYGRLAPGVTKEEAGTELRGLAQRLATDHPETNEGLTARVERFSEPPRDMKLVFLTALATVLLVLLVACTNVANLLLSRAAGRTRELAVSMALGASRRRITAKLMAEAAVLVGIGAALGIALCWVGLRLMMRLAVTSPPPFWFEFKVDPPLLLFVAVAATLAAGVAGMVPGLRVTGTRVSEILKDDSRGSSGLRIGRLSRLLVISELAFSVGLLVSAGLFVKGMVRMRNLDQGVFQEEVMTARLGLFEGDFPDAESRRQFFVDLGERLRNRPEIVSASFTSTLPGFNAPRTQIGVPGVDYGESRNQPQVGYAHIAPDFFRTFGIELISGRDFTAEDGAESEPVAIVNRSFVNRLFPGEDAVGRRFRVGTSDGEEVYRTIVGVAPDLYLEGLMGRTSFHPSGYYIPMAQADLSFVSMVAKGQATPESVARVLRDEVAAVHADTPLYWVRSMARALREEIWYVDLFGGLFAVFGALALVLAAAGLYAVMATGVARRTREVGVRMALGARSGNVLRMILRQGAFQIGMGLLLGLALAAVVSKGLRSMLFGVEPWDISVFLLISAVMLASGLLASLIPARRATRVDPVKALRAE